MPPIPPETIFNGKVKRLTDNANKNEPKAIMEYFFKFIDRTLTISAEAPSETVPVVGDIIRDSHEIARVTTASSGPVWATRTVNTLQFGSDSNAMISE